jgi:imidazolonepropionase-like amidohydrolase
MNGSASQTDLRKKLKNNGHIIRPNIHYSHLVRRTETFTEFGADSLMQEIRNSGIDFIKLLGLSNEETFDNLTKAANKYHIIICGHYPVYQKDGKSTMISMEKVAKSNFKSIEHLAGYIWLQEEELKNALKLTKENNIYNCPTLDWDIMAYDLQFPDEYRTRLTYRLLPKSIAGNWESNYAAAVEKAGGKEKVMDSRDKYKPNFTRKLNVLKRLYESRCLLLIGSDAGSAFQADGFNVYEEMIHWKNVGIDNFTILKSATVTPSQFFNEQNMWGTIEAGKNAEMIILKKNPLENIKNIAEIETTIVGGKLYNNKELIRKL